MSNNNLLTIEPLDLQFPLELKKKISCSLYMTNKTDNNVAFKIKTTNVADYSVSLKTGVVLPRSACEVLVTLRPQKEVPSDMQCKDKFLVQGVIASHGVTSKEITREMFSEEAGHLVVNTKLSVTYVCSNTTTISNNKLLTIEPLDLQFPFELKKKIFCSFYLTNKTDSNVAFKVKTTNVENYYVRPNTGVVLPRSICEVLVTLRPQNEAPSDIQCTDKFLVQAVIASHGVTAQEITREMFSKEAGHLVENTKLSVTYVYSNTTTINCSSRIKRRFFTKGFIKKFLNTFNDNSCFGVGEKLGKAAGKTGYIKLD